MDEWDEIYCEKIFAASIYITIGILSCNSALYLHRQNKTIAAQTSVDEGEEKRNLLCTSSVLRGDWDSFLVSFTAVADGKKSGKGLSGDC